MKKSVRQFTLNKPRTFGAQPVKPTELDARSDSAHIHLPSRALIVWGRARFYLPFVRIQAKGCFSTLLNGFGFIDGALKNRAEQLVSECVQMLCRSGDKLPNARGVVLKLQVFAMLVGTQAMACHAQGDVSSIFKDCAECPEMVVIPAGSFQMGSSHAGEDAMPVHRVTFDKAFVMGRMEVTQGQWKSIMGNNPSEHSGCGDDCPVEKVSWNEVHKYIENLNIRTGRQYRLPSEAEWEYACQAGENYDYCGGNDADRVAWFNRNAANTTHPVAGKQANAWGLYDMSGNVWEWVEDRYHDTYDGAPSDGCAWLNQRVKRVVRGGSWCNAQNALRAANRGHDHPGFGYIETGFRLARSLP